MRFCYIAILFFSFFVVMTMSNGNATDTDGAGILMGHYPALKLETIQRFIKLNGELQELQKSYPNRKFPRFYLSSTEDETSAVIEEMQKMIDGPDVMGIQRANTRRLGMPRKPLVMDVQVVEPLTKRLEKLESCLRGSIQMTEEEQRQEMNKGYLKVVEADKARILSLYSSFAQNNSIVPVNFVQRVNESLKNGEIDLKIAKRLLGILLENISHPGQFCTAV